MDMGCLSIYLNLHLRLSIMFCNFQSICSAILLLKFIPKNFILLDAIVSDILLILFLDFFLL